MALTRQTSRQQFDDKLARGFLVRRLRHFFGGDTSAVIDLVRPRTNVFARKNATDE